MKTPVIDRSGMRPAPDPARENLQSPYRIRRQVAVFGFVFVRDTAPKRPLAGAQVLLFGEETEYRAATRTNAEGLYWFMDLPNGKYRVEASLPHLGSRAGAEEMRLTVKRDKNHNIQRVRLDAPIALTSVKGKVTGPSLRNSGKKGPLGMAEIRVWGSGERTFTNEEGDYNLTGIEPGSRRIVVSTPGYAQSEQQVTIGRPGSSETLNFTLKREGAEKTGRADGNETTER